MYGSGFLRYSRDYGASVYVPFPLPLQQLCFLANRLIEPSTDSLRNGMERKSGVGEAYAIFPSLHHPSYFCDLIGPNLSASLSQPHTINLHLFQKRRVFFPPSFFDYARAVL